MAQAVSLANCFYGQNLTQPLLEAVTSKSDVLKVTSAEYAFAQTPCLHYLPQLQGENLSSNAFKGTCLNSSALKQLRFSGTQGGTLAESLAEGCLALKDVKTKSPLPAPTDISKMFKNCQNLCRLPAFDYTNMVNAVSFLENCTSLQDTALDFSSADNLKKLSIGATQQTPLNAVKSIIVSRNAPFDGISPQIDVSYTGLNRSALVNLFNSLPYNIGYTVTGSPVISDGIASGFSTDDYCDLAKTFHLVNDNVNTIEIATKITTGTIGTAQGILGNGTYGNSALGFFMTNAGKPTLMIYYYNGTSYLNLQNNSSVVCEENSVYYLKGVINIETGTNSLSVSTDNTNWITTTKTPSNYANMANANYRYRIGKTQSGVFSGSIDLNNTYIKLNGITFFNGGYGITKNCNITGCNGTETLSADDKVLATAKGWEILE